MNPHELGRLSKAEMEVMKAIWSFSGPVTVQQMLDVFAGSRNWKTSTMSTILSRLIAKGFLVKAAGGRANLYAPAIQADEYKSRETRAFLSAVHSGSMKSFISALADGAGMDAGEIAELREWFEGGGGQ
ncbi:MAG: BlaI/MecI/CopY family transcriptional regulator [Clostridiales bacterium]|jgi:BlaI family penicillinase repressor|nr:BlaI/MecI/CopY family transcriptional regulator [Clostridiales bacterium]